MNHIHFPSWVRRAVSLYPRPELRKVMSMSEFTALLEPEIPRLRRYALALTRDLTRADDLVQSCLVRALAKEHLWQPGTDLRAWLFTILHNQHVNDVRSARREGMHIAVDDTASSPTISPNALASLQLRDLERAIARLPDERRQVLLLVGLEGMRYEQVAEILNIPVGTVRSRLSRSRRSLREMMGGGSPMTSRRAPGDRRGHSSARRAA
jgi:RNA polymerase sigma-70 factor (ECF subfamily)